MSSKQPFVSIPSRDGERFRRRILEAGLLNQEFRIAADESRLLVPLIHPVPRDELVSLLGSDDIQVGIKSFDPVVTAPRTLAESLQGVLTSQELDLLPRAYDLIGDIAVLEIPDELRHREAEIGASFHRLHKNFSTVLAKRGAVSGTTRIREYELLSGVDKTDTVHTEYGCRIAVDLAKAYFSPRLLEEHRRIAEAVIDGEHVVDMFTGVGPFAIHIAKLHQAEVYAIDINPDAITLLKQSMKMNRLVGTVIPVVADAHEYVSVNFNHDVDRIIMNHPTGAMDFVGDACKAVRSGGRIHYYGFAGGPDPESIIDGQVTELISAGGRSVREVEKIRRVRDSAPYEFQMVADIIVD